MASEKDHAVEDEASPGSVDEKPTDNCGFRYLIVRPENGSIKDLLSYSVQGNRQSFDKFLESNYYVNEGPPGGGEMVNDDHRWVVMVSIVMRKIIAFLAKPMEWVGWLVDFLLNLLFQNGNLLGLIDNVIHGKVVVPRRGTDTFISTIGHLDRRIDLYRGQELAKAIIGGGDSMQRKSIIKPEFGNRAFMDLCMMASKLAYENAKVIKNIVNHHWKMHFLDFYDCWNDFQKQMSTQVFIFCDNIEDANLIIVSFRGTEPFDADDWSTDFDYSWYEIPNLGKIHMGFLEALGLGSRTEPVSFYNHIQAKKEKLSSSNVTSNNDSDSDQSGWDWDQSSDSKTPLMKDKRTAYYVVRGKLRSLLNEHKNAKFVVTGHSLGGALAILFPTVLILHEEREIMERLLGVYTYGQPRIGNKQLGRFMEAQLQHHNQKYYRVVYCNDLVPRLPYDDKTFLYKHFGVCLYYNSFYIEQKVNEEPNKNLFGLRYFIPEHLNAAWELMRSLVMGYIYGPDYKEGWFSIFARVLGLALPGISAHSPTNYVNSIRLGKDRTIQMSSF
ncbi:hypothetical protein QN277_023944 [Acacia crassicarpa]|uniref:Fungal lipase-type domain-containing protein n=1 Tax=Acacia crassicarpa TaxID=499986 RepID=A0AAE1JAV4_9FABA|nr:hypothetical protein QN277_023944 [Acacia crassicarpa]